MAIKISKPTTPGRRKFSTVSYKGLSKVEPEKRLLTTLKRHAGRNNTGRITVRHRGGGHKRRYRIVDFKRTVKNDIPGKVSTIEYDPYRSAFIMLVTYADGDKRYHLAPNGINVGDTVLAKEKAKAKIGNRMMLKNIPLGFEIFNLELTMGKGGQIVRSAGSSAKLASLDGPYAHVELPSKEMRYVHKECYATIGRVSNLDHMNVKIGKAGRKRHMGWRPTVRGKAMNPVDHPHGGGEGGTSIGMKHPKTPWGLPALGVKTRRPKKYSNKMIVRRRKKKR
jgi:large subunit ribosomal protein L2